MFLGVKCVLFNINMLVVHNIIIFNSNILHISHNCILSTLQLEFVVLTHTLLLFQYWIILTAKFVVVYFGMNVPTHVLLQF